MGETEENPRNISVRIAVILAYLGSIQAYPEYHNPIVFSSSFVTFLPFLPLLDFPL
jgi:hypothetical protein